MWACKAFLMVELAFRDASIPPHVRSIRDQMNRSYDVIVVPINPFHDQTYMVHPTKLKDEKQEEASACLGSEYNHFLNIIIITPHP